MICSNHCRYFGRRSVQNSAARRRDSGSLVFVVQADTHRVMGVVRLAHHVGDGQLDLVRPDARALAARHQLQRRRQVQQDGGGLPDHQVAVLQEGRGQRRLRRLWRSFRCCSIAGTPCPAGSGPRATSMYGAPAASSARRTNSPRPWMVGQ
jgi:hypothetical protein